MSEEFILKNINETRSYFLEEIEQNKLMSKKDKNVCTTLNYIQQFLFFSFYNYWMYFNFCFCYFISYSNRNSEFCNRIVSIVSKI